ncbi:hypothetical protein GCO76_07885 [Rickettsia sp. R2]
MNFGDIYLFLKSGLCNSCVGGNPLKSYKNLFLYGYFIKLCNSYINIKAIFLDSRIRGNDIRLR